MITEAGERSLEVTHLGHGGPGARAGGGGRELREKITELLAVVWRGAEVCLEWDKESGPCQLF